MWISTWFSTGVLHSVVSYVCKMKLSNRLVLVSAVPIVQVNTYITHIEYSPLIGGFAVVFNDGRAAFLTAVSLKFDPNVSSILSFNSNMGFKKSCNHKPDLGSYISCATQFSIILDTPPPSTTHLVTTCPLPTLSNTKK